MAGSADIRGKQHYIAAIGHPASEPNNEAALAMVQTNQVTGMKGFVIDGIFQPPSSPITTPSGFRGTTLAAEMDMRRTLGGIVTNFDITSKIPPVTKIYYVDPINGANANAGTSVGAALQDLSAALAKSDVDQIIITGLTADYIALGARGWNNTSNQSRSISVINRTGYRFISTPNGATMPTGWTINGTYPEVSQVTVAAPVNVTDLKTKIIPSYVNEAGQTVILSNVPAKFQTLKKVASLAAVAALAGSWFHDGTVLYVRPHDSRSLVGDQFMLPSSNINNGRFTATANNLTIYVEGIDFVGGGRGFYVAMANTITGCVFAHNNCSFQGAGVFSGGLAVEAFVKVYGYRSASYENWLDGFNYHSNGSPGTNDATSPDCVEIECVAQGNGTTGDTGLSNNASTGHEACNIIRLNCVYVNSDDRPLADINFTHSWNLGCTVGAALTSAASQQNIVAANSTRMWLDSTYAVQGANPRWVATQTAVIKHFNSGAVVNDSTGEATGTIAAYYG